MTHRLSRSPFTGAELALLRRGWSGLWPLAKILAELAPRRPGDVLAELDALMGPPANGVCPGSR